MTIVCPECDNKLEVTGSDLQMGENQSEKSVNCEGCGLKLTIEKDENSTSDDS
jgi:transcription elongation factor Elf1